MDFISDMFGTDIECIMPMFGKEQKQSYFNGHLTN